MFNTLAVCHLQEDGNLNTDKSRFTRTASIS